MAVVWFSLLAVESDSGDDGVHVPNVAVGRPRPPACSVTPGPPLREMKLAVPLGVRPSDKLTIMMKRHLLA